MLIYKWANYLVLPVLLYLPPLLLQPAPLLLLPQLVHHVQEVGLVVVDARDLQGRNSIHILNLSGKSGLHSWAKFSTLIIIHKRWPIRDD